MALAPSVYGQVAEPLVVYTRAPQLVLIPATTMVLILFLLAIYHERRLLSPDSTMRFLASKQDGDESMKRGDSSDVKWIAYAQQPLLLG